MRTLEAISKSFKIGLDKLGLRDDNALFLTGHKKQKAEPEISFLIETAQIFKATAVYVRKQLNGSYKPQIYLFDFTNKQVSEQIESEIADIQKRIWSSGEVPLACIFLNTEVRIIDCTKHLTKDFKPEYLIESLKLTEKAHALYNEQFAIKIKTGIFWEQDEIKGKFNFKNSAYDTLIRNIRRVTNKLSDELKTVPNSLINKIIVQAILIKYLEETTDNDGKRLLSEKYFKKYKNSYSFSDVLKNGKFVNLLFDLNRHFNGNVFGWDRLEQKQLESLDLTIVADLLATDKINIATPQLEIGFHDLRYFEFKFIPVELISRLYEEFLGENKKDKGLFYTPSHLAKLLVDECLPLKRFNEIDLKSYLVLDPACGSGIFLVTVFKRLVQIWRLQHNLEKRPGIEDLKSILRNIFGVDKEEQAVMLSSFSLSLALCNELKPIQVIEDLKFDDLTESNLFCFDFFMPDNIQKQRFDLIIGNPPFKRGAISAYSNTWPINGKNVKIPQGQIALKFLSESFKLLKENGLVCLIIKSSGLLYNSTSNTYKKALFSNYNVIQVLDFTSLARNKSLWDGADVATAAIFIRNSKPDPTKNILHLTFRRTKATIERITFEVDDYDLHYINRQAAIYNEYIWKNNLLGGGRIINLVEKVQSRPRLAVILDENNSIIEEGFEIGSKQNLSPSYIYKIPFLPTKGINENGIDYNFLSKIDDSISFSKIPPKEAFTAPNLIIWENIGEKRFPIFYNEKTFSFKRRLISIKSLKDDDSILKSILKSFEKHYEFYKFYLIATSSETLINRNNTFLLKDLKNIPVLSEKHSFSQFDLNTIKDSIEYMQDFFIRGEKSKTLHQIKRIKIESVLMNYGTEFSRALNSVYENKDQKFRLSDVVELENASLIAAIFKYDSIRREPVFYKDLSELNIESLTKNEISSQLSIKRIIKLYPQKDTIVFVKPNQYKYWISLTAYRDADKCFADLSKQIDE